MRAKSVRGSCFAAIVITALSSDLRGQTPTPGQNVNMVSGRQLPGGDPFLQRQGEPAIAVSSRNPLHLLAGANDYRTVDLPLTDVLPNGPLTGDAWLGLFKSFNGGQTWQSTLIPGYPQDGTVEPEGTRFPGSPHPLHGFTTASDPVVRSGTNGLFYYAGIAFDRATNRGAVFVARYIDLNNRENGSAAPSDTSATTRDPIRYNGTFIVDSVEAPAPGQPAQFFLDKPWIAVDVPRAGALTCDLLVAQPPGAPEQQTFRAGNIYIAYTKFTLDSSGKAVRGQLFFSRSRDCGASWSQPAPLLALDELRTGLNSLHQGVNLQVDPQAGFVYAAWRRFKNSAYPDSILGSVSIDGGRSFFPGVTLWTLPPFDSNNPVASSFFDQSTTETSFRTNAFPALAVDDSGIRGWPGRIYLAWSQRIQLNTGDNYADAHIMMLNLPGGILVNSSGISLRPYPLELSATCGGSPCVPPLVDDSGHAFSRGHQFMPQLTFTGGKLVALYYDMRLDHTYATFTPALLPDPFGRFFLESRQNAGELLANPVPCFDCVFTPVIDDRNPPISMRRHTMDVVVAEANPGFAPRFTVARVSRYKSGTRPNSIQLEQLQVNPGGLPLFRNGTAANMGDYLDIAGQMFVPKDGSWSFNTAPLKSPWHVAVWTSNQDVRPPPPDPDGKQWQRYTPVGLGTNRTSFFDPSYPGGAPDCVSGREGMRNQNIYSSRITEGLLLTSPQNSKRLSSTVQRAFVVVLQNFTSSDRVFRLTIAAPPSVIASFLANDPTHQTLDVRVAAHSGIARPVFALSSVATASITVTADEISEPGPTGFVIVGGLSSFVVLNPDGTVPPLINPDGAPAGSDITSAELYNPDITNPDITNPNATNPDITNPNISKSAIPNPDITNPDITNPDITNPDITNPDITNPDITNANPMNPDITNPDITNSLVSDATYVVTNSGNTTASYRVKLVGSAPDSAKLHLILSKTYLTPFGRKCFLFEQSQSTLLSNVLKPAISDGSDLANPDITNPDITNATLSLQPGETALITLRGNVDVPTMTQVVAGVTPVVIAHAANTGTTTPQFSAPLTIRTTTLPNAIIGQPYSATLQAFGGNPPYSWSLPFQVGLPPGLDLGPDGTISGTADTAPGAFTFTVEVTDQRERSQRTELTIAVVQPLSISTKLPEAIAGFYYSAKISASGGTPPYSWKQSGLPAGLAFDGSTGSISGSSDTIGVSLVTMTVTDSSRPPQQVSADVQFTTIDSLANSGPGAPTGGDFTSRGFYIESFPGTTLTELRLAFTAIAQGIYTFRVTVRSATYDGTVLSTSDRKVFLPAADPPTFTFVETPFVFPFPGAGVERNSRVTFTIEVLEGPVPDAAQQVYYAVECGGTSCSGPAIETEDTTPPLSIFRRSGVWGAFLGQR